MDETVNYREDDDGGGGRRRTEMEGEGVCIKFIVYNS